MIRVLVAEDSPVVRELLINILRNDPDIRIVGAAKNGLEAVAMAENLRPDVITMDICMPRMNGVEATKLIMAHAPTRIIVVSASGQQDESRPAFEAIKAGALTLVDKPYGQKNEAYERTSKNLIKTIKLMSSVKVITRWQSGKNHPEKKIQTSAVGIIAIGASTGGPAALSQILRGLPADFAVPIVIVQHMTSGFGTAFTAWLNSDSPIPVRVSTMGETLTPGNVYVAPDNYHFGIDKSGRVILTTEKLSYNSHRPSINFLFDSVAKSYGPKALGVLLTGMGEDGALGMREIKSAGGQTIAQDEQSSIVFGMPKSAIGLGAADRVVALEKIAPTILTMV